MLPHWTENVNKQYATKIGKRHSPPERLHSPYYPLKGPYSSRNAKTMSQQFEEMVQAGGSVAVISWWGQGKVFALMYLHHSCVHVEYTRKLYISDGTTID